MKRTLTTPALGIEADAYLVKDADNRPVWRLDRAGVTLGYLTPSPHGSRRTWGWSIKRDDPPYGRYADMNHALQGLLIARANRVVDGTGR